MNTEEIREIRCWKKEFFVERKKIDIMVRDSRIKDDVLIQRLGQMVKENAELEQRVNQLTDDYNRVVNQLREAKERKEEHPIIWTFCEMRKMRDLCDELDKKISRLMEYEKSINSFVKAKKLYMPKGMSCLYWESRPIICSTRCLECNMCLGVLKDLGVVCKQKLSDAKISFE